MGRLFLSIGLIAIWGLLAWGNYAVVHWSNGLYEEDMASNYAVNTYEGRVLLRQEEYSEFKRAMLDTDIKISQLDVYGSPDVLIIYDITASESSAIPYVGEPQSQVWRYSEGRAVDYCAFAVVGFFSVVAGLFLTVALGREF